MLIVTSDQIEGRRIAEYLGIASGDAIVGAIMVRDLFARVRDAAHVTNAKPGGMHVPRCEAAVCANDRRRIARATDRRLAQLAARV